MFRLIDVSFECTSLLPKRSTVCPGYVPPSLISVMYVFEFLSPTFPHACAKNNRLLCI